MGKVGASLQLAYPAETVYRVATRIEDSFHDTALTMAAIESAHTGRAVDVPEYTQAHLDAAAEELGVPA